MEGIRDPRSSVALNVLTRPIYWAAPSLHSLSAELQEELREPIFVFVSPTIEGIVF